MARKMVIVHGYSDGSTSFTALRDFFVEHAGYDPANVFLVDYSSMDDEATFRDFADKLDLSCREQFGGDRVDVACHSTGALVVRAWLALHHARSAELGLDRPCPVDRLLMFAPANFGSDLAKMGQSFLGKFRSTFFNSNAHGSDFLESGKIVLQGLEPASPFQWALSELDLHAASYFDPSAPAEKRCYPFVLAAGNYYGGLQAKLIPKRKKPGTDGTVRIAGTSLNTRKAMICFRDRGPRLSWETEHKFRNIPFAVFDGFNHGSIVDPGSRSRRFMSQFGPGTLALEALKVTSLASYARAADRFVEAMLSNLAHMRGPNRARYQQFFFRVRDDVDQLVEDYFLDFHVTDADGVPEKELTLEFDREFEAEFHRHSVSGAHRVMMVNCSALRVFLAKLTEVKAKLVLDVSARALNRNVGYAEGSCVLFDGSAPRQGRRPAFLHPNTTTLIDVVLNRTASDQILHLTDHELNPIAGTARRAATRNVSGRATFLDE